MPVADLYHIFCYKTALEIKDTDRTW